MKWQYLAHTFETKGWIHRGIVELPEFNQALNDLGRDGWELVSIAPVDDQGGTERVILVFKRPA